MHLEKERPGTSAFADVREQVGYCGLWCGSCIVGNGTMSELTERYRALISGYGVDEWGATAFDGKEFMKGLASIKGIPVCRGCLKGGGNATCAIRACATGRGVADCLECGDWASCDNSEAIRKVREGALKVGMIMKDGKWEGNQIDNWTRELRGRFPCCVIDI
jgi:hypothetical protein